MAIMIRKFLEFAFLIAIVLLGLIYLLPDKPGSVLRKIRDSGTLTILTVRSPTTFYIGPNGYAGFDYDLAKAFADYLKVDLEVKETDSFNDLLAKLANGTADFVAAGITVTESRKKKFRFSPVTETVTQQLIYREGNPRPEDISGITNSHIETVAGKQYVSRLKKLKREYSELSWREHDVTGPESLLYLVWQGLTDFAIANSNSADIQRFYYPELYVAFDLSEPVNLAWAFPKIEDTSLYDQVVKFMRRANTDGTLRQIHNRYYGHIKQLGYLGKHTFMINVYEQLDTYEADFKKIARKHGVDWRFLAAMAYQESHWQPDAISPTGVAGMMMLTENTARQLEVEDRTDLYQSLDGGMRYFKIVKEKIPERIPEPDHTWLALAAYNVGYGHLEDARILTETMDGDPDKWVDVEKHLPLLSKKKWYSKTRHGRARGQEPVEYVRNIRSYYDLLVWHTTPHSGWQQRSIPSPTRLTPKAL